MKTNNKLEFPRCMSPGLKMAVAFAGNSTAIQEMFKRRLLLEQCMAFAFRRLLHNKPIASMPSASTASRGRKFGVQGARIKGWPKEVVRTL